MAESATKADIEVHDDVKEEDLELGTRRTRQMTMKGLEYTVQMKRQRLDQLSRALEKTTTYIQESVDLNSESGDVTTTYIHWVKLFDEFLSVDHELRQLLKPSELTEYEDDWLIPRQERFLLFKRNIEHWFADQTNTKDPVRTQDPDEITVLTSASRSSRSSSKSKSTVKSARLKQEKKKAELVVKAELLKQKRELEEEKLRLKLREEEINLQEEIAISEAHCKVLDDLEERASQKSISQTGEHHDPQNITKFVAKAPSVTSDLCSVKTDSNALMSVVQHLKKPSSDLKKFSGNPLDYARFMRQFKAKVVANCSDAEEQLNFLEQYTSGEAQSIVTGFSYLEAQKGYTAALKELDERYGDQDVVVDAFISKALSWPTIKPDNPKELDRFSIFLKECDNAIENLNAIKILEYSENMRKIVAKLPYVLHDKWRNVVCQTKEQGKRVTFKQLVTFVSREAKKAVDPTFGREAMSQSSSKSSNIKASKCTAASTDAQTSSVSTKKSKSGAATKQSDPVNKVVTSRNAFSTPCTFCEGPHALESCTNIFRLPFYDRLDALRLKGFCYGCLRVGHQRKDCRNKATCSHCNGRHPSILHVDGRIMPRTTVENGVTSSSSSVCIDAPCHTGAGTSNQDDVTMAIIPVKVGVKGSCNAIDTYAFLDPGSNISFCSETLMSQLGHQGKRAKLTLNTMGVPHTMYTYELKNIEISDLSHKNVVKLPSLYTKDRMPVCHSHIPTTQDISKWPHLTGIELPQITAEVGLLLGNNVPDAYSPLEVKVGPPGSPHASKTRLGWVAWNVIRSGASQVNISNRADVIAIQTLEDNRNLETTYKKSLSIDFPERIIDDKPEHSVEDRMFLSMMYKSQNITDGHFEYCLPFKEHPNLPDNSYLARQRLKGLKRKFLLNNKFHVDYTKFMSDIIDNGYAEKIPDHEVDRRDGKVWYIPHHGVYNPRKPDKIRVVFDCSSKYQGISLNQLLLQGPDMTNNLLGVLMRFRQEEVALMSDIKCMFYQVYVTPDDRDCLRFFWWPRGELEQTPVLYRMKVHLFGASSSPSCANYALQETRNLNREYFDSTLCDIIKKSFYVDDFLCSSATEAEAINLVHEVSFMCLLGGFHLTKWLSNRRSVLESIDETERAKEVKDLSFEEFPSDRALGVLWEIDSDTFSFKINTHECAPTRRGILSLVSSVYDPLGLASPFVLSAKIILQEACRQQLSWDDELPPSELYKWTQWLYNLPKVAQLSVPRCVKPCHFGQIKSIQLHHFSDASELAYGITSYLRIENDQGMIHCTLLISRSRVAPLKKMTIPRLELTAATVAVRMSHKIQNELRLDIRHVFWTDSMSVIRYIANETTRFHTFVANRIALIRDATSISQWKYVESKVNPADIASRGSTVDDLVQNDEWVRGPKFLQYPESEWPTQPHCISMPPETDPEVKQCMAAVSISPDLSSIHPVDHMMSLTLDWSKLKRLTAWILVGCRTLRRWANHRKSLSGQIQDVAQVEQQMNQLKQRAKPNSKEALHSIILPDDMLLKAEMLLIRHAQKQYFSAEIIDLESTIANVKATSSIRNLDPFMYEGIIRVGGRLSRSNLPYSSKHQILIPHQSPLANMILSDVHRRVGHFGKNAMITELRKHFWIPRVGTMIKSIVSKCVLCRKYHTRMCSQKMADLPEDRVVPDKAPFSHTGMDYFGLFVVKRGRTTVKRYGVIFTCFSSRAVHLEVAYSLNTDSCIHAIRRFISRRGSVESIRSDNGTNLVGAERELRESITQWNQSKIGKALQQKCIKWNFNPPSASHFGGVWERLIRSVRRVMYALLYEQVLHLDDESLHTLFCEIERILNSRPITSVANSPHDVDVLTPNDLLLLQPQSSLPCGVFDSADSYSRRRWRQVQYLASLFWIRWRDEYLHLLQQRQKWTKTSRNLTEGDIVLVVDQQRTAWTMAKVLEVTKDKHGLVRVVKVKTPTGILHRPIHKLSLVLEADAQS